MHKYCDHHAVEEIRQLSDCPAERAFRHALVIPAFDESDRFLKRLYGWLQHGLLILVINQPRGLISGPVNDALFQTAINSGNTIWQAGNLRLIAWPGESALLLVDRFSTGREIPSRQGVGLARKIGCDLAIALRLRGRILSPWIHSTDADAHLPADYFEQTVAIANSSAALYRFSHRTSPGRLGTATRLYEQALNYYVAGLQWARSPYAFHTIGSCVALDAYTYCLARGFPKRNGGEDFYLLNKFAKLAPVAHCEGGAVELEARASRRVPFGTGPAVTRIMGLTSPETEFLSYDPQVFVQLQQLLDHLALLYPQRYHPARWKAQLSRPGREAWDSLQPAALYRHLCAQVATEVQAVHSIRHWFDGFRTLKFIHQLQVEHFPPVPLQTALQRVSRAGDGFPATGKGPTNNRNFTVENRQNNVDGL